MICRVFGLLLLMLLVACAQSPYKYNDGIEQSDVQAVPDHSDLPKQALTAPILFEMLLGETALQRGNLDIAIRSYLKLVDMTRDPRIAQRASEIALHARHPFAAEQAAKMWIALAPNSQDAQRTIAALLVNLGKLDEAQPHLKNLLAADKDNAGNAFLQLSQLLVQNQNKAAVFQLVQQLAEPYPDLPEAYFSVSQAAWHTHQYDIALNKMERALELRPDWEVAAILKGQIIQRISTTNALDFYKQYLDDYSDANDVRIAYIRLLVMNNEVDQARDQIQQLLKINPDDAEMMLKIGLLSAELRDFDVTEASYKKALDLGYKDHNAVNFQLGRIYEETERLDIAMETYKKVRNGEQYLPAQIRYAVLLTKKGHLNEARQYLQQLPTANDQQAAHLILAEAQLLRGSGDDQQVFNILDQGLKKLPDYPELLYDRALAADRIGKYNILERDLRKLIKLKPDNAHAYNALGYSLAERGNQLPEALSLIKKAVELSPDDPYIMDSLGWVYYRMGNINDGLNYLNLAFATRPDPEIAAHLGEVLWTQGAKEDAERIWRAALKKNPDNKVLIETINRFMP